MMTCMDYHETSLPLHSMIPTTSILPHPVFSIMLSLSSNFTPCLLHYPQSTITTPGAHPSHKQCSHVLCPGCGHLNLVGVGLTCH